MRQCTRISIVLSARTLRTLHSPDSANRLQPCPLHDWRSFTTCPHHLPTSCAGRLCRLTPALDGGATPIERMLLSVRRGPLFQGSSSLTRPVRDLLLTPFLTPSPIPWKRLTSSDASASTLRSCHDRVISSRERMGERMGEGARTGEEARELKATCAGSVSISETRYSSSAISASWQENAPDRPPADRPPSDRPIPALSAIGLVSGAKVGGSRVGRSRVGRSRVSVTDGGASGCGVKSAERALPWRAGSLAFSAQRGSARV